MGSIAGLAKVLQPLLTTVADAAAAESGCVQRVRRVTGANFVQTLVFGWLGRPAASLGQLARSGGRCGLAISPQGLAQRFTAAAADCLKRVLDAALAVLITAAAPAPAALLQRFNGSTSRTAPRSCCPIASRGSGRAAAGGWPRTPRRG